MRARRSLYIKTTCPYIDLDNCAISEPKSTTIPLLDQLIEIYSLDMPLTQCRSLLLYCLM
jgi:hypothetical protein